MMAATEALECDYDTMELCCGAPHEMVAYNTYTSNQQQLIHLRKLKNCPKWFSFKCRCYGG